MSDLKSPRVRPFGARERIRLLVVERPPAVGHLLTSLLGSGCIVEIAQSQRVALDRIRAQAFDAAVVDSMLPDGDGLKLAVALRHATSPCATAMMSDLARPEFLSSVASHGITQVLFKPLGSDQLLTVVEDLCSTTREWRANGSGCTGNCSATGSTGAPLPEPVISKFLDLDGAAAFLTECGRLTERESEVLRCMLRGESNQQMVLDLCVSINTVKFHVRNVLSKLGLKARSELFRLLAG